MFFEVQDLTKTYTHNGHRFAAVDHLSFSLAPGEILAEKVRSAASSVSFPGPTAAIFSFMIRTLLMCQKKKGNNYTGTYRWSFSIRTGLSIPGLHWKKAFWPEFAIITFRLHQKCSSNIWKKYI